MAELKIKADSGGGTVSFKGPSSTTSNAAVQLTLPVDDGAANQVLTTNGSGALSWAAPVIADDSITEAKLDVSNGPTNGLFLQANSGGGGLTWANAGVTHGATWRLTTSFTGDAQPEIASNWEEVDTGAYSTLGSGISESSGIFSLPATGYWFIIFSLQIQHNGTTRYTQMSLETTTNNSTYAEVAFCSESAQYTGNSATGGASGSYIMDVTDTSNCKFKFAVSSHQSSTTINGNTAHNWTSFTAFRLADT